MRQRGGSVVGGVVALLLALCVGGIASAQQPAQRPPQAQEGPGPRRELLMALAALANVTPQELRAAQQDRGGLIPALQSLAVPREQILKTLTAFARRRFAPAVTEGRLTHEQAEQLAQQQARRLFRRLGGTPRGR